MELLIDIALFAAVLAVPVALLDVFLTVRARRQKRDRRGYPRAGGRPTTSRGRGKAVPAHDRAEGGEIGRAAGCGVEDGRDLAEVVGTEDAGSDDRERFGVDVAGVVEPVDRATGDAEHLARADLDRRALDRPGQHSLEAVDRLLVAVVAVGGRDPRAGRNVELEDRDRPSRLLALDQEPDRQLTRP